MKKHKKTENERIMECKEYVEKHKIQQILKDSVIQLLTHRPNDPIAFFSDYFQKLDNEKSKKSKSLTNSENTESDYDDDNDPLPEYALLKGHRHTPVFLPNPDRNHHTQKVPKDVETIEEIRRAVKTNILFKHLDADEQNEIIDMMFEVRYDSGDVIIKQDDDGDNFYIIDKGQVEVFVDDKYVATLFDGESFGELALIHGTKRAATVKAKTFVMLWAIDRDTYRQTLMESIKRKRIIYDGFLKKVLIFESLTDYERDTVADALESVQFKDGDVIVHEGDRGDHFYLIEEGTAIVYQRAKYNHLQAEDPHVEVGQMGPSDYFGEIALLLDRPRAATVMAKGPLKCVKLDRSRFERLLGPCMDILKRNMEAYNSLILLSV